MEGKETLKKMTKTGINTHFLKVRKIMVKIMQYKIEISKDISMIMAMSIDMKTKETQNEYYWYSESREQEEKWRGGGGSSMT